MIARLRRKFIVLSMLSVAVVLALILGTVNALNWANVTDGADAHVDAIVRGGGVFAADNTAAPAGENAAAPAPRKNGLSPEAPFDTRYFTVRFTIVTNSDGTGSTADSEAQPAVDVQHVAAVTSSQAQALAQKALAAGAERGFSGNYRYRLVAEDTGSTLVVFVDCARELSSFHDFLVASAGVSALGLVLVLALLVPLSRVAVRPIAQAHERQRRFITDASHELKTPLAVIDAAAAVLELEAGESEWTESIHAQVERLGELTGQMLALARLDEGVVEVRAPFDIAALVRERAAAFRAVATSRGQALELDVPPALTVEGDVELIGRCVDVLLDNAFKYGDVARPVRIAVEPQRRGTVRVTCENGAEHIERGDHAEFFDRFYRADSSRTAASRGFGVGLSIVAAAARLHGGEAFAVAPNSKTVRIGFTLIPARRQRA